MKPPLGKDYLLGTGVESEAVVGSPVETGLKASSNGVLARSVGIHTLWKDTYLAFTPHRASSNE